MNLKLFDRYFFKNSLNPKMLIEILKFVFTPPAALSLNDNSRLFSFAQSLEVSQRFICVVDATFSADFAFSQILNDKFLIL